MPTETRSRTQKLESSPGFGELEVGSRALALDSDARSEELASASAAHPPAGVAGAVDRARPRDGRRRARRRRQQQRARHPASCCAWLSFLLWGGRPGREGRTEQ
jgi:hypothetical protein